MTHDTITIPVRIDPPTFKSFAAFDTFKRQKRWKSPAIFTGILLVFACVCFALHSRNDQALFIGSVLLVIALGLPAVYFGMFFHSVDNQAKALKLNASRLVYTVELNGSEGVIDITGTKGEKDALHYPLDSLYRAYRTAGCIYLYASERQAFLLPDGQGDATQDELWDFLTEHMKNGSLIDCRK